MTLLRGLDRCATAAADVVLVDTAEHRAMLPEPGKAVVVPVGAPDAWFEAGERTGGERAGRAKVRPGAVVGPLLEALDAAGKARR